MRLIVNELFKLFSKHIFAVCVVISLLANGFFFVFIQETDPNSQILHNYKTEYIQLLDDCLKSSDQQKFIESKDKEIEIGYFLLRDSSSENSDSYDSERINSYKENYPNEFSNAVAANLSREELQNEKMLLVDISSQIKYIDSYDKFINEMDNRAKEQLKFSIFTKKGTFAYNNIQKTPSDFEQLKDIDLVVGNNSCVKTATTFQMTDYLVLILVILMCIFLFSVEREIGLYPLVRSTTNGRIPTALSKLAVIAFVSVFITIAFYVENILVSGWYFGFGDFSRSIQSIDLFMNCSLKLNIGQYIILWIIGKVTLFTSLALVLSFIFTAIKNSSITYAVLAIVFSLEFFCFMFIQDNSSLNMLKFVNPVYLMSGNNIFGKYQNVNFFQIPVNIITVHILMCLVFVIVGIIGTCISFAISNHIASKSQLFSKISEHFANKKKIRGSVKIYSGEAFKHYKTSFCAVVLIALVVFGYSNLTKDLSIVFYDSTESTYNTYMQNLEGEITQEKYNYIESEKEYFDNIKAQISQLSVDESLDENEINAKINSLQGILDNKEKGFDEICTQLEYAEIKAEEINAPVALVNEITTKRLLLDTFRDWGYFTLMMAVVIFCTSNIFACEYKHLTVNLLRSNKNGKSKLILTKLFTVLITTIISYVLIYLPYMINYINTFGTSSFDLSIAFSRDFELLSSSVSVIEIVLITGILHFIACITATIFVFMLSLFIKNNFMTMIVSSGLLIIPCIITMNIDSFRTISAFKSNSWISLTVVVLCACILISAVALTVTFKSFNNVLWRKKYVKS